jgi:hypothetical protein
MNTLTRNSRSIRLFFAAVPAVLLLMPSASLAQTDDTSTGTDALSHDTGGYNSAFGYGALYFNTTGSNNTGIGFDALFANTESSYNTAIGAYALANNTSNYNSACGYCALYRNTTGQCNTATGYDSLFSNTTGVNNTVNGYEALYSNTNGLNNTANGAYALFGNTAGSYNTASGFESLFLNTTGTQNVAIGNGSLYANTTGSYNTGNGFRSLASNTTGADNTATGNGALDTNTEGTYNVANGVGALLLNSAGNSNTAEGYDSLSGNTTGSYNIALGSSAGSDNTTGNYNIDIGNVGSASDSGVIRIGTNGSQSGVYIQGIDGKTSSGGVVVYIDSNGKLGTLTSSRRFKFDIKDIGTKSDKLMDLRPVAFRYKEAAEDGSHPIQYGLIAEEVAKVYPDLVQYDKQGKPFTVYYNLLTPMMLNELQKAHHQLAAQQTEFGSLKATVQNQSVTLQTQSAALSTQRAEVASLRHTNQVQFMFFGAFVLGLSAIALVFAGYAIVGRKRRSSYRRTRSMETCVS